VHRIELIKDRSPFVNRIWILSCILTIAIQVGFFFGSARWELLKQVPWWIYIVGVAPIGVIIGVNELVKMHARAEWIRFQKRTKLEFNTKLGMHSPL
jgi:hypothetical protein